MQYDDIIQTIPIVIGLEGVIDVPARLVDALVEAGLLAGELRDAAVEGIRRCAPR